MVTPNQFFHSAKLKTLLHKESFLEYTNQNLSAQSFLLSQLPAEAFNSGIIWQLANAREIAAARILAEFFLQVAGKKTNLYAFPDDLASWTINKNAGVLLVPHEYATLSLPHPAEIQANTLHLNIKDAFPPLTLIKQLVAAGYSPGPLADTTGWYERKGGIVTISTSQVFARITWDNDLIETITELNPATGTKLRELATLTLPPRELEPQAGVTIDCYLAPSQTLIGWTAPLPKNSNRIITLDRTNKEPILTSAASFTHQWDVLIKKLDPKTTYVLTSRTREVQTRLPNLAPSHVIDISARLATYLQGFEVRNELTVLTDRELFGVKKIPTRVSLAAYDDLTPGDHLVHIDHGICVFDGLQERTLDGITREYFVLAYAAEDKLLVPVEHTDRLSKYRGSANPHIERLSTSTWVQTKRKAKAEAENIARDLLKLYATREVARVAPWYPQPEERLLAKSFPYSLTPDQQKAWSEISADLESTKPMDRLVCGDVGFGKTELAIRASLRAVLNSAQVAVLAPTTILAQQHADTFCERLESFGIRVALLSRSLSASASKKVLADIAAGTVDVVIGTHKLLNPKLAWKNLGLMVVDEEQRFGVKQKERLKQSRSEVRVLTLSATPIPRTLHLAVGSVRELSLITSAPPGRKPVKTTFTEPNDKTILNALTDELDRGGQAYYLVHHINEIPAAETRLRRLLPNARLGILHGRLPGALVEATMHDFDSKKLDILIATTIIENGIDLPNVNTLIVERADSFGLSDLYQLKGRVGRSSVQGYAYFLISSKTTALAEKRLDALASADALGSGLSLALKDLELRGAGELLGQEQHGHLSAVGLHLYGELLATAIHELQTGISETAVPEVRLNLPLEGRIPHELIPDLGLRLQAYQRLARIREAPELLPEIERILGRKLTASKNDLLVTNLITLLELKLAGEAAGLVEISCLPIERFGRFALRFATAPEETSVKQLQQFDKHWHQTGSVWQADRPLHNNEWVEWLKQSLAELKKT